MVLKKFTRKFFEIYEILEKKKLFKWFKKTFGKKYNDYTMSMRVHRNDEKNEKLKTEYKSKKMKTIRIKKLILLNQEGCTSMMIGNDSRR